MDAVKKANIGKTGNVKGSLTSAEGAQNPVLPGRSSYKNGNVERKTRTNTPNGGTSRGGRIPFLPNKPK